MSNSIIALNEEVAEIWTGCEEGPLDENVDQKRQNPSPDFKVKVAPEAILDGARLAELSRKCAVHL